jgi:multidrug efflux pump subunit AcrB
MPKRQADGLPPTRDQSLRRPYTFVVMALLIIILTPITILRTPVDIFPEINIPVVSVIWVSLT